MFKRILLLTPAILFMSGCLDVASKNIEKATDHQRTACYVVGVSDGDTLTCLPKPKKIKWGFGLYQILFIPANLGKIINKHRTDKNFETWLAYR